jgi:hypothetical protein
MTDGFAGFPIKQPPHQDSCPACGALGTLAHRWTLFADLRKPS